MAVAAGGSRGRWQVAAVVVAVAAWGSGRSGGGSTSAPYTETPPTNQLEGSA